MFGSCFRTLAVILVLDFFLNSKRKGFPPQNSINKGCTLLQSWSVFSLMPHVPSDGSPRSCLAKCYNDSLSCLTWRRNNLSFVRNPDDVHIQTHKRIKRTLFIGTEHSMRMFGVIPFIKLQNDIYTTVKRQNIRGKTGTLMFTFVVSSKVHQQQQNIYSFFSFDLVWLLSWKTQLLTSACRVKSPQCIT